MSLNLNEKDAQKVARIQRLPGLGNDSPPKCIYAEFHEFLKDTLDQSSRSHKVIYDALENLIYGEEGLIEWDRDILFKSYDLSGGHTQLGDKPLPLNATPQQIIKEIEHRMDESVKDTLSHEGAELYLVDFLRRRLGSIPVCKAD